LSDTWLCSLNLQGAVACVEPGNQAGAPMSLAPSVPLVDLAVAGERVCVLDHQGSVRCADASDARLGSSMMRDVVQIESGSCHFCARTRARKVHCWGCNHAGQAGASVLPYSAAPTLLPGTKTSIPR
jgi:hypothetical protein